MTALVKPASESITYNRVYGVITVLLAVGQLAGCTVHGPTSLCLNLAFPTRLDIKVFLPKVND